MEEFKQFFGEDGKSAIDYDTFNKALEESGMKIADLSKGGYVDINKYNRIVKDLEDKNKASETSQAEFEQIKTELATLKAEKEEARLLKLVSDAKVDDKFIKFVVSEVKSKVTDKTSFDKELTNYLKDNPQFVKNEQPKQYFKFGSQLNLNNGGGQDKDTNKKINDFLRKKQ